MSYSQGDNSSLYYQEMNNIILQSSEQSNKEKELFNAYISSGKYTQQQINDYQKDIERRNKNLYFKESNDLFISFLKKEEASIYFNKEEVSLALKLLREEKEIKRKLVSDEIEMFKDGFGHFFSSPLFMEDRMIVFHTKTLSKLTNYSRLLIYNLDNGKLKLDQIVYM